MSSLVLQESSDPGQSSSDDELNLINKESSNYNFKKMIKSADKVDKRLFEQYLIQRTHRQGVSISREQQAEQNKIEKITKEVNEVG